MPSQDMLAVKNRDTFAYLAKKELANIFLFYPAAVNQTVPAGYE